MFVSPITQYRKSYSSLDVEYFIYGTRHVVIILHKYNIKPSLSVPTLYNIIILKYANIVGDRPDRTKELPTLTRCVGLHFAGRLNILNLILP